MMETNTWKTVLFLLGEQICAYSQGKSCEKRKTKQKKKNELIFKLTFLNHHERKRNYLHAFSTLQVEDSL